jgi:hypothetical protein
MGRIGRMNGGIDPPFITSAIDGEWSVSCPTALIPGEEPQVPISWLDLRAGLDAVE